MTTRERWLPVIGYEGIYEVSDQGRVRSLPRVVRGRLNADGHQQMLPVKGGILAHAKSTRTGHHYVALSRDGGRRLVFVHALVLEAFKCERPEGLQACHNDGDVSNNRLENLRWDSASANALDKVKHGRHNMARKTHCKSGHPYDAANTYIAPNGGHRCKTCSLAATARWRARRAGVAA